MIVGLLGSNAATVKADETLPAGWEPIPTVGIETTDSQIKEESGQYIEESTNVDASTTSETESDGQDKSTVSTTDAETTVKSDESGSKSSTTDASSANTTLASDDKSTTQSENAKEETSSETTTDSEGRQESGKDGQDDAQEETAKETTAKEQITDEENTDSEGAEISYPAQHFAQDVSRLRVSVQAKEDTFPEGTTMNAQPISGDEAKAIAQDALSKDQEVVDAIGVDITFYNADGDEIQPRQNVEVGFEVIGSSLEGEAFTVIHQEESGAVDLVEDESVAAEATASEATFEAEHFSIYVIAGTNNPAVATYTFYDEDGNVLSANVTKTSGEGTIATKVQRVKNGEYLYMPETPEQKGGIFQGWTTTMESTTPDISTEAITDGKYQVTVSETATINLYPVFSDTLYVFFMDELKTVNGVAEQEVNRRVYKTVKAKRGEVISTEKVTIPLDNTHTLTGWYLTADCIGEPVASVTLDKENVKLYPKVEEGHFLSFSTGDGGSYIEPEFYAANDVTKEPTEPTRAGYKFIGWSTRQDAQSPDYKFGTKLTSNQTLYAVWAPGQSSYTIIYWKQSVSDKPATASKNYDYETSKKMTGQTGDTIHVDKSSIPNYKNFNFNELKTAEQTVTIKGDGSSVYNVYYDRNVLRIHFYESGAGSKTYRKDSNGKEVTVIKHEAYGDEVYKQYNGKSWIYLPQIGGWVYLYAESIEREHSIEYTYYGYDFYSGTRYKLDTGHWYLPYVEGDASLLEDAGGYTAEIDNSDNSPHTTTYKFYKEYNAVVYTGLYGSTLASNGYTWKTEDGYVWKNENKIQGGHILSFLDAFIFDNLTDYGGGINKTDIEVYKVKSNNNVHNVYHYQQKLDGSYDYQNPNNSVPTYATTFNFTEKYTGFTMRSYLLKSKNWKPRDWDRWNWDKSAGKSTEFTENYDLHIRYERNKYNLVFYNGSETVDTKSVLYEDSLTKFKKAVTPKNKDSHYTFDGWYKDKECTEKFDFNITMPANNIAVYAKWIPDTYKVTVYGVDGKTVLAEQENVEYLTAITHDFVPTVTYEDGTSAEQGSSNFERIKLDKNDSWSGWSTKENDGKFKRFAFDDTKITADIALYPYVTNNTKYQVVYDLNGGSGTAPTDDKYYASGAYADIASAKYVTAPAGKIFLYWTDQLDTNTDEETISVPLNKHEDGAMLYPGGSFEITLSRANGTNVIKLYAVYGDIGSTTTLTYRSNYPSGYGAEDKEAVVPDLINNAEYVVLNPSADLLGFAKAGEGITSGEYVIGDLTTGYWYFTGWTYTDANGVTQTIAKDALEGSKIYLDLSNTQANVLTAKWEKYVTLTIEKKVRGSMAVKNTNFTFQYQLYGDEPKEFMLNPETKASLQLMLKKGTVVSVEETDSNGYVPYLSVNGGKETKDVTSWNSETGLTEDTTVTFINEKNTNPPTGVSTDGSAAQMMLLLGFALMAMAAAGAKLKANKG